MLTAEDIRIIQVGRDRLDAHRRLRTPKFVKSPLTRQFRALGTAILAELLDVDDKQFERQLGDAIRSNVGYVCDDVDGNRVGVSVATSLTRNADTIRKNVIVPMEAVSHWGDLDDHLIIGAFITGEREGNTLHFDDDIEIAGWISAIDAQRCGTPVTPPTFKSKLEVVAVPCTHLNPIEDLYTRLEGVCV